MPWVHQPLAMNVIIVARQPFSPLGIMKLIFSGRHIRDSHGVGGILHLDVILIAIQLRRVREVFEEVPAVLEYQLTTLWHPVETRLVEVRDPWPDAEAIDGRCKIRSFYGHHFTLLMVRQLNSVETKPYLV